MRKYPKSKYTEEQIKWCENYENQTTFQAVMCNFESGEQTFKEAARWNVRWFEDWMQDAHNNCDYNQMSFSTE